MDGKMGNPVLQLRAEPDGANTGNFEKRKRELEGNKNEGKTLASCCMGNRNCRDHGRVAKRGTSELRMKTYS